MALTWYSKQARVLRKVVGNDQLEQIIKHLWNQLKTSPLDRQWHIHRALNSFRFFQPVLQNNIWIDKMPPSFCFEEYRSSNGIHIEVNLVDQDSYSIEQATATLFHWLFKQDSSKEIYLASFHECLYSADMFSEFEIVNIKKTPCYWTTHRVPTVQLPPGFRMADLRPSDARRIVESWPFSLGEVTVKTLQKLWSAGVKSYQVLTDEDESVAYIMWNRGVMENIYVDERYRRLNIGKALQTSTIKTLFDMDCRPLGETECDNIIAQRLVETIGFTISTSSYFIKMRRR